MIIVHCNLFCPRGHGGSDFGEVFHHVETLRDLPAVKRFFNRSQKPQNKGGPCVGTLIDRS